MQCSARLMAVYLFPATRLLIGLRRWALPAVEGPGQQVHELPVAFGHRVLGHQCSIGPPSSQDCSKDCQLATAGKTRQQRDQSSTSGLEVSLANALLLLTTLTGHHTVCRRGRAAGC